MGMHLNAYTSRENTAFYAKSGSSNVGASLEMLSDMVKNTEYDVTTLENEKQVVLQELDSVSEMPFEVTLDYLHDTAFQGTPLARNIIGTPDQVQALSVDGIRRFKDIHYKGNRTVIVGAGGVNHDEFVEMAEKHFGSLEAGSTHVFEPAAFTGSDVLVRDDSDTEAHVAIAFQTVGWNHPDVYALMVMQQLLGSWTFGDSRGKLASSRLVRKVAENNLASSVSAFNTNYSDTGLFGVYTACEPAHGTDQLQELSWAVLRECVNLFHNVTDEEVTRAKTMLKSQLANSRENTSSIADDVGRQLIYFGRHQSTAETFARIDSISSGYLRSVADKYINDRDVAVAALGRVGDLPDYNWLRRRTYMLRN
mmetsp:Transcript_2145/g.4397  ORF Transcript_2145/g.4397 Transcript_2145/m.4397 type:complete len:366 (-) Transcript_2145:185-1282(-)